MVLFRRRGTEGRMAEVSAMKQSSLTIVVVLLVVLGGPNGGPDDVEPVRPFDIKHYQGRSYVSTTASSAA
jgi:hypothetical protein